MTTQSNPNAEEQTSVDDANADALFNEFAEGRPAADIDLSDDGQGAEHDAAGQARDEQGRFASSASQEGEGDDDEGAHAGAEDGSDDDPVAQLERYKQEAQQWQHRYQSDLGRQSALQRKITEQQHLIDQLQTGGKRGEQQPAGDNPEGSGMTDAQWETLKQDFPDLAKALDARFSAMTDRYEQQIEQLKGQIQPIQQQAQDQAMQAQFAALDEQHPDWRDTVNKPEFHNWLQQQPVAIQNLVESDAAADAAYLLSTFKLAAGAAQQPNTQLQQRRQRQLQSAQTVPSRGGRQRSAIPDNDEDALFDYFANQ